MKKLLFIIFSFVLTLSTLVLSPSKVYAAEGNWTAICGDDTVEDLLPVIEDFDDVDGNYYYVIHDARDLTTLACLVNLGYDFSSDRNEIQADVLPAEISLVADIDLSSKYWTPIGNTYSDTLESLLAFRGVFKGNGYTINGMTIDLGNDTPYQDAVGLFGYTEYAEIENVNLTNVDINVTGTYGSIGALVGEAYDTNISKVKIKSGSINYIDVNEGELIGSGVGGLVGVFDIITNSSSISKSSSNLTITADGAVESVGGLVGGIWEQRIFESYSNGSVYVDGIDNMYVGGLVGYTNLGTIQNTYSTASVFGFDYIGGLVGYNDFGYISDSYAIGGVSSGNGTYQIGKLLGGFNDSGSAEFFYENIYYLVSPEDVSNLGIGNYDDINTFGEAGTVLDAADFEDIFPFNEYPDGPWYMDPYLILNSGYPTFLSTYTITYDLDSGANAEANPASFTEASSLITLAAPTRTGYTFAGWYTDSAFTTSLTTIPSGSTSNVAAYAKWTATTVTPTTNTQTTTVNTTPVVPLPNTGIDPSVSGLLPLGLALLYLKKRLS